MLPVINVLGVLPVLPVLRGCKGETGGESLTNKVAATTSRPRPRTMTDYAGAQPAKTPTPTERVTTLKNGAARARQGRGLSGRVGDVAAQGRSVAKALPHDRPDRAAVGLTDQADNERGTPVPRAPGHGLVLPGARRARRKSGGAATVLPPCRPAIAGLETWRTLSAHRRQCAGLAWRGVCDQPCICPKGRNNSHGRHENQPIFAVDRKARMVFTVPTWPAPHRPPAAGVAGAGAALAPSPAGERRLAGVALADGWPGRGG